jgi:hypothetical protein
MNTIERVVSFLRKNQNVIISDDCLRSELKVSTPLDRMLDVLSPDHVKREIAVCGRCGAQKLSTMLFRT